MVRLKRAETKQRLKPKTAFVKLRFNDFENTTIQTPSNIIPQQETYSQLVSQAWQRGKRPVRLIGIGIQFNPPDIPEQLSLFQKLQVLQIYHKLLS